MKEKDYVILRAGVYKDRVGIITGTSVMQFSKKTYIDWCTVTLDDGTIHHVVPEVLKRITRAEYLARLI